MVEKIIEFVKSLKYQDIPQAVLAKTKQIIIDTLGVAILGSSAKFSNKTAVPYLKSIDGDNKSTIIGHHLNSSLLHAGFINTVFARIDNFDETFEPGIIHPGAPIIMSTLAVGEKEGIGGKDFLTAIIAGYDIAARIAREINPEHYNKGFHTTGTVNCFGTAMGVSKLLKLKQNNLSSSLSLAATQASGIRQFQIDGDMLTSAFHAGKAALNGIQSAYFSLYGFPDTPNILQGKYGFFKLFTERKVSMSRLTRNLGYEFLIDRAAIKPYPCCRFIHGAIDAALQLKKQGFSELENKIKKIKIKTFETANKTCNIANYKSITSAKFSLQYCVATALLKNKLTLNDFSIRRVSNTNTRKLAKKIEVFGDPLLEKKFPQLWVYELELITNHGKIYKASVDSPLGSIRNPMSQEQLKAKFESLSAPIIGEQKSEKLFHHIENIHDSPNLKKLASLLIP